MVASGRLCRMPYMPMASAGPHVGLQVVDEHALARQSPISSGGVPVDALLGLAHADLGRR